MTLKEKGRDMDTGRRERVAFLLLPEVVELLHAFCREKNVPPDRVVERALIEYFREGDMSH